MLTIIFILFTLSLTYSAYGDASLDRYFNLRREHKSTALTISQVKADPAAYNGRVIELRGTLSGVSRGNDRTFFIMDCGEGCYVISSENMPDLLSGCRICILAEIGPNCVMSLSDLKLVALANECEVVARERKAIEAEQAKQAAKKAAEQKAAAQNANRLKQAKNTPSSSGNVGVPVELVPIYKNAIKSYNSKLTDTEATTIANSILGFSYRYKVDPRLVVAVILAESHFKPTATSPKGAMGLGQLMPGTAAGLGVSNAYDPVENVEGSVRLIKGHLDKLSGNAAWNELTWQDLSLALASYNAGSGAVKKYGGVPPYRETRNYIDKVISTYKKLCGIK